MHSWANLSSWRRRRTGDGAHLLEGIYCMILSVVMMLPLKVVSSFVSEQGPTKCKIFEIQ